MRHMKMAADEVQSLRFTPCVGTDSRPPVQSSRLIFVQCRDGKISKWWVVAGVKDDYPVSQSATSCGEAVSGLLEAFSGASMQDDKRGELNRSPLG